MINRFAAIEARKKAGWPEPGESGLMSFKEETD
jgi:hypothetical protein